MSSGNYVVESDFALTLNIEEIGFHIDPILGNITQGLYVGLILIKSNTGDKS